MMTIDIATWVAIIGGLIGIYTVLAKVIKGFAELDNLQKDMQRVNDHLEKHSVDIGMFQKQFDGFERTQSQLNDKFSKADNEIKRNRGYINGLNRRVTLIESVVNNFSAKNSPRQLNDLGLEHYKKMRGEEFLKANKDYLFNFIDNEKPISAWDVEKDSLIALESMIDMIEFKPIKDYLYIAPERVLPNGLKSELNEYSACQILYLPLRDMYLEAHPELQPKEIFA